MISWMQRHKKWLVITIWISTIAFVGAGFVGWGSYDYGSSSGSVATVGSKEVKVSDLQNEYNALYNKYQSAFGESFNQELAKQFKLEEAAYDAVVQKFLLLNYADELGLYITDEDVAKNLVQITAFHKDGKFDKDTYLKVLGSNRTSPTDFENQVKKDLLVSKIQLILNTNTTKKELNNLSDIYLSQDRVSIQVINSDNFNIDSSTANLKKYWEKNKDNYKSLESYKIAINKVEIGKDKKASKKDALKKYLKLKKGELKFDHTIDIDADTNLLTAQNVQTITQTEVGTVLKPVENNKEFIIVKLVSKQQPKTLSFENALKSLKIDFIAAKKQELLSANVSDLTKKFNGKDIGFISRDSKPTLSGLEEGETVQLVSHIFNSNTAVNSIVLGNKAVVYKITDSRLSDDKSSKNSQELEAALQNMKNNEIVSNLLKQLQNKYEVKSYMKAN